MSSHLRARLPRRWNPLALLAVIAALACFANVHGWFTFLVVGVPGAVILSAAMASFALPSDERLSSFIALGGAAGIVSSVFVLFSGGGLLAALLQALLSFGTMTIAGRLALQEQPSPDAMPLLETRWPMDIKAGFDEMMVGYLVTTANLPNGEAARRMADDAAVAAVALDEHGWRNDPARYHETPPTPIDLRASRRRIYGFEFEQLCFESGYIPRAELPGAASWSAHVDNRMANAWVLRHAGPERPWLVCVHGYRMGNPWLDFSMFRRAELHEAMGVNLLIATLPLHGPRKSGFRSGDDYLDGDVRELLLAETQALWDLRRWLLWLREVEQAQRIGVYGVSLGGHAAALLASYVDDVDFVIAGMPLTDIASNIWRLMPESHRMYFAEQGLDEPALRALLRVVSPLALPPKLPPERLHIVAATGDRVVPPTHAIDLAQHWQCPVNWYQGSHLSFRREELPWRVLEQAMRAAGWPVRGT